MKVMKDQNSKIEYIVSDYEFSSFVASESEEGVVSEFEFNELNLNDVARVEKHEKVIRLERKLAADNRFKIAPIVKEHRGLADQERKERGRIVEEEVRRRVERIRKKAHDEGYEQGVAEGKEAIYQELKAETEDKLVALTEVISEALSKKQEILTRQRNEVYQIVRDLTKWVVLRELKEDGAYISRLLEKLIHEIQTKSNLLVKVSPEHFEQMPDVLEIVQSTLGKLPNVRVENDYDLKKGLILESENGIIDAGLDKQLDVLEKLFDSLLEEIQDDGE